MEINTEDIKKIAEQAGKEVLKVYRTNHHVSYKKGDLQNPLTEADLTSEKIIKRELAKYAFPILSEESADDKSRLQSEYVWIVDPLDGTSDFVEKTDEFAIMIGLAHNRKAVLGVVYEPVPKCFYWAEKEKGAFKEKNGRIGKIRVSDRKEFEKMKILMSRNHLLDREVKFSEKLGLNKITCGSAGLKVCKIASGEAEIYANTSNKTSEWDTCAGNVILKEAAGIITDMSGSELEYNNENPLHINGYVATNGVRHDEIIEELAMV